MYFLLQYLKSHTKQDLWKFINTAVTNIVISILCIIIAIFRPQEIKNIDISILIWLISGALMAVMLILQISIFVKVYRRSQMPENYHYNFFGKKVLHSTVASPVDIALFFASIPFLLVAGAYFVARIIRLFL